MSRALNDLSSQMQPRAFKLLARLTERTVMVMIVDTLRTPAEHAANLKNGTSNTLNSKHLPRALRHAKYANSDDADKSDAMDICPYDMYQLNGPDKLQWDPAHPAWRVIGEEAERLGLRWGGRWKTPHDPGHVELETVDIS
jgi:hypothetical protein